MSGRKGLRLVDASFLEGTRQLNRVELSDADAELLSVTLLRVRAEQPPDEPPPPLIQSLEVDHNSLSDASGLFEALPAAIPECAIVNLASNRFTAATFAAAALQKAFASLPSLHTL